MIDVTDVKTVDRLYRRGVLTASEALGYAYVTVAKSASDYWTRRKLIERTKQAIWPNEVPSN